MAAPRTTTWTLDPHTRAKHAILRRYLQAWMPILTRGGFREVAYVDGFAGPGRYDGGEDGSPIIALKAALEHREFIRGQVVFRFIEEKRDRAAHLKEIITTLLIPSNFQIKVDGSRTFEEAFSEFSSYYMDRGRSLPPTFAFIDPFGWTGVPFSVLQFILGQPSCEVLVTFMYEEINRFIAHPDQIANFDSFFGTADWREGVALTLPRERNRFLHDLYVRQLRASAKAKYVRSFQMQNAAGATDYYLFYATNSLIGLGKMKEAMWKVDSSGDFMFSDATDPNQSVLFSGSPRFEYLEKLILAKFKDREATVGKIEEFVLAETPYRETHYKRQILRPLECREPTRIQVLNGPATRHRGTFADPSLRIRFL